MKDGNWIAMRKGYEFPKHREFSEIEAAYSLQLDYDNGNEFTVSGMASNWKWSETKVRNFLSALGLELEYPDTMSRKKRGILIPSKRRIKEECSENKARIKEECKLFCFDNLEVNKENKRRIKEDKKENKAQATIEPNPNTINPSAKFEIFWGEYPKKKSRGTAERAWGKINLTEQLFEEIIQSLERAKTSVDWTKEDGKYIPHPATWLNGKRWLDVHKQPREKELVLAY